MWGVNGVVRWVVWIIFYFFEKGGGGVPLYGEGGLRWERKMVGMKERVRSELRSRLLSQLVRGMEKWELVELRDVLCESVGDVDGMDVGSRVRFRMCRRRMGLWWGRSKIG